MKTTPPPTPVQSGAKRNPIGMIFAIALMSLSLLTNQVMAATETWNGGGADFNWSTVANWVGGVAPVAADDLIFTGSIRTTNNADISAFFNSITFDAAASSFIIQSAGNIGTNSGGIVNNSANLQTISVNILALDASQTWNAAAGNLFVTSVVSFQTVAGQILTIDGSFNTTISGNINEISGGTGGITKIGTGTLTLSGANTYTGVTNINGGILALGSSGALGGGGSITFGGGTLQFSASNTNDYSARIVNSTGAISLDTNGQNVTFASALDSTNTGGLTKLGTGILTLSGANTYTGVTNINGGILALGSSGALGGGGSITFGGGTLQFSASNTNDYSARIVNSTGAISLDTNGQNVTFASALDSTNTGGLTKLGTGTLILSGANTYTGATDVNVGSLIVDGSITSNTTVDPGALLGGSGTIFGSLINNGTVSPGNGSAATLTVSGGTYTQNSGGTLTIQLVSNVVYDKLVISGTAALAGTLQIVNSGYTPTAGDSLDILSSSGRSGVFGTVINPYTSGLLYLAVVYTPTDVLLVATQNTFANALSGFTLTPNQTATAAALDSSLASPLQAPLLAYLDGLPIASIPGQLDLIAPEELTAIYSIGYALMDSEVLSLEQRFADIRNGVPNAPTPSMPSGKGGKNVQPTMQATPDDRNGFFITATGSFINQNGDPNANGYDIKNGGTLLGMDVRLNDRLTVGVSVGYARADADLINDGKITVDSGRAALYAIYHEGGFYAEGLLGGGYSSYDTERAGVAGTAKGSTHGGELDAAVTFGYDAKMGALTITPMASLLYTLVGIKGYDETGSLAPLHIESQSESSLRSRIGLRTAYTMHVDNTTITPSLSAQWQHEFLNNSSSIESRFANGSGNNFTVNGPHAGRDSALLTAALNVSWSHYAAYLAYQANLNRNYESQSVLAGFRVSW